LENLHEDACLLNDVESAALVDARGRSLDLDVRVDNDRDNGAYLIGPEGAWVTFSWKNWCGAEVHAPLRMTLIFADGQGAASWTLDESEGQQVVPTPSCLDSDEESELAVRVYDHPR
jgi:hypothetical protein